MSYTFILFSLYPAICRLGAARSFYSPFSRLTIRLIQNVYSRRGLLMRDTCITNVPYQQGVICEGIIRPVQAVALSHFFAPEVINVATSKLNASVCDEQMSYFLYDCFVKGARPLCSLS